MERESISAATRKEIGKSAARHLRAKGQVPAVLYGRGRAPVALEVDVRQMSAALAGGKYSTHVFDLQVSDEGASQPSVTVMIKEVQRDPITSTLFNIDFHAISLTEKVQAQVPVVLTGEPVGVKQGGILERLHSEISVSCLPTSIPEQAEVDISAMEIGDSIHASALTLPSDVELLTSPEEVLAILAPPAKVVEEVPAAVAEGEEEAAEPEVTAQKGEAPAPEEEEKKPEKEE
ncbi:MAG: 50S ribosomal protein L25 [Armatimonadetes bacterium]|nr:50S ribosomal protein L25 [Armatimonadota bacterium]NIM22792.1 50S ribosomal protein L25 [Armatimonadota bacterium]NIM66659.1 50S ribosomal protein L25 [Armatimonadota bacterium]NIM75211.1 50S ribosomal protein L25 [Armatimonadota bacterium]NIN04852.1 50S ribosomal protein L25 [Armatimonadota bacterium]